MLCSRVCNEERNRHSRLRAAKERVQQGHDGEVLKKARWRGPEKARWRKYEMGGTEVGPGFTLEVVHSAKLLSGVMWG